MNRFTTDLHQIHRNDILASRLVLTDGPILILEILACAPVLLIIQSYDLLLDIDDMEKKALALPEDVRPPLFQARAEKIQELFTRLHLEDDHNVTFIQLVTVRKGTKLVARTLPFLNKVIKVFLCCKPYVVYDFVFYVVYLVIPSKCSRHVLHDVDRQGAFMACHT